MTKIFVFNQKVPEGILYTELLAVDDDGGVLGRFPEDDLYPLIQKRDAQLVVNVRTLSGLTEFARWTVDTGTRGGALFIREYTLLEEVAADSRP